ncbi:hypothetical protein V6N13_103506 [Hibiscus sabdariffa]
MRVRGRASDVGDAEPKRSRNLWDPKKKKLPEENTVELLGICKASSFSLSKHVILRISAQVNVLNHFLSYQFPVCNGIR